MKNNQKIGNRKGITLLILVTAIAIMMVLISSATVIGANAINTANYNEYQSNLNRVSNNINFYYLQNGSLPVTQETVSPQSLGSNFYSEVVSNVDSKNKLFVVDMSLILDPTVKIGKGTLLNKDVFLVSEQTHNVYYVNGFRYKGKDVFALKK